MDMFPTRLLMSLLLMLACASGATAQDKVFHDRNAVPGNYFVGLYADERGTTAQLTLEPDQLEFDAYIGVGGDSTKVFSGLVLGLELPRGVEIDGPIIWSPIPGLTQEGSATLGGLVVEFNKECVQQRGVTPAMVARVHFTVDDDFEAGSVQMIGHVKHGLSLELCHFVDEWWPKPFAQPIHLELTRKTTFWGRIRDFFHSKH
jgi:hypothetical protein